MSTSLFGSPGRIILTSMVSLIMIGTLLLSCSWAQLNPLSLLDCLFTATSAVCVTGLMTVPLAAFSPAGQVVILLLIQIGAIGLISLTISFLSLFTTLGLSARSMTGEALDLHAGQNPGKLALFTILFTLAIELIGWICCFIIIYPYYPLPQALCYSLFHAVASFCGAGISLVPLQAATWGFGSLVGLLTLTAFLVFIGGLGFIVWYEMASYTLARPHKKHMHLSLHTRLVMSTTAALIGCASVIFLIVQYGNTLIQHPSIYPFLEALFNAICLRSSGFTTLPVPLIQSAILFVIMLLSFIGSSPCSTGSGVKTTTFAIFVAAIKATLLRRNSVEAKGRTIPNEQVFKAMAIFALSIAWIAVFTFLLLLSETAHPFDLLFEAFSSFTNLGLSRSLTPFLSYRGKLILILSMLVGRIGSLTVLLALKKQKRQVREIHYPEERVFLT